MLARHYSKLRDIFKSFYSCVCYFVLLATYLSDLLLFFPDFVIDFVF